MPSVPNKISIVFEAKDKNLKTALESIASTQEKWNKVVRKSAKVQKSAEEASKKAMLALAAQSRVAQQNAQDVERLNKIKKKQALMEADVERRIKTQTQADIERLAVQKKAKIAAEKAAKAAKKLADAQSTLNLETKNTSLKLRELDIRLKKAGINFKKAGISGDVLKKALRGDARALSAVTSAANLTIKASNRLNKGFFALAGSGRLLHGSFATIRSKMLLFSFAASIVSKAILSQVKAFAEQEESVQRMASVFGVDAALALDKYSSELQKVTIFGDEQINVVMAQLGAFGANEEQTKQLTKATLDLSAGMGIDLTTAALLTAKSFGTSTNALTRYGIELKSSMSSNEKAAAIVEQVKEKYGGLSEQLAKTTSGQLAQARNAMGDFAEAIGAVLAPAVLAVAKALKIMAEALTAERLKKITIQIGILAAAFKYYQVTVVQSTKATVAFKLAITTLTGGVKKLWGVFGTIAKFLKANLFFAVVTGVVSAIGWMTNWFGLIGDNDYVLNEHGNKVRRLTEEQKKLIEAQREGEKALQKQLDLLNAKTELDKYSIEQARELSDLEIILHNAIQVKNDELEREQHIREFVNGLIGETVEKKRELLEADIKGAESTKIAIEARRDFLEVLQSEIPEAEANIVALEKSVNREQRSFDRMSKTHKGVITSFDDLFESTRDGTYSLNENTVAFDNLNASQQEYLKANAPDIIKLLELIADERDLTKDNTEEIKKLNVQIKEYGLAIDLATGKLKKIQSAEANFLDGVKEQSKAFHKMNIRTTNSLGQTVIVTKKLTEQQKLKLRADKAGIAISSQEYKDALVLAEAMQEKIDLLEDQKTAEEELQKAQEARAIAWQEFQNTIMEMTQSRISQLKEEGQVQLDIINRVENAELGRIRNTWAYQQATDAAKAKMEKKVTDKAEQDRKAIKKEKNKEIVKMFRLEQGINISNAVMNTSEAYTKVLGQTGIFGIALAPMVAALGAIQIAMIAAQSPPTMARGGVVGGALHSQGGTMINAEKGEYVVSRAGVESIGIETLNKINSGSQASGSSIVINNPILGKDTIEDEIIPQIKEALRRGGDIGIG